MEVRSRFAPSPTGYMHIGNLRTALYEYLVAKSAGGKFILRIEDTDQERYVEGAVDIIYKTMKMVGLKHDEGPDIGGNFGPYVQSERKAIYKKYADILVELGGAHYCFCSEEELENQRKKCEETGVPFKFDDPCKNISIEEAKKRISNGEKYTVRQTINPDGEVSFDDVVYGHVSVETKTLDEGILLKSDGLPTYNFANVVDDHLMNITHVLRGNEYLSSTPKYNLMYQAFGWDIPTYVHLPPIMKDEHNKLSKRNGDASFQDLVQKGYLPEAIVNYIVLLGWSAKNDQEIFSMEELEKVFNVEGINKSPAIFDIEKLKWMNGVYIRELPCEKFYKLSEPWMKQVIHKDIDFETLAKCIQPRVNVLNEIPEAIDFIEMLPEYDTEMYIHKKMKTTVEISKTALLEAENLIKNMTDWSSIEAIHDAFMVMPEKLGLKNGQFLWPIRTALTGKQCTPTGAIEIAYLLGKEECLSRIQIGINKLG